MIGDIIHGYDRARICVNGHIIDQEIGRSGRGPQPFCDTCGAEVIEKCPASASLIRGRVAVYTEMYMANTKVEYKPYDPPAYCYRCSAAFPWTERGLTAAGELVDTIKGLKPHEKQQLRDTFPDLITDTPRTITAAVRFRTIATKGGEEATRLLAAHFTDIMVGRAIDVIPFMHR